MLLCSLIFSTSYSLGLMQWYEQIIRYMWDIFSATSPVLDLLLMVLVWGSEFILIYV